MKKYSKFILPLAIIILVIVSLVLKNKTNNIQEVKLIQNETSSLDQVCYEYKKASDISVNTDQEEVQNTIYDREYIKFSYLDNARVTGTHDILPAGRDSNRATFIGVTQDGFLNVIATAIAEGETWQEQRIYKIENDQLFVGYQKIETPKYLDENEVYMYKDLNNIVFETEEFFLNKVACDSKNLEN